MRIISLLIFLCLSQISFANNDAWMSLQEGGKVILMRHMPVNEGNSLLRDQSCKNERNISNFGKAQALLIKREFNKRKINIGQVYSSPFCRTTDSAKLIFNKYTHASYLTLKHSVTASQAELNLTEMIKQISLHRGSANLVLLTHSPNIESISFEVVEMGAFLVLNPLGSGEFEEVGLINIKPQL